MNELTVLCISDKEYLPYLNALLNSFEKNVTCIGTVIIYLINVDKDIVFRSYKFKLDIRFESGNYDKTKNKLTRYSCGLLNGRHMSDHHAYCNNLRYMVIPEILKKTTDPLLYIDVDNIVRKDLIQFVEELKQYDISIFKYPLHLHPVSWRRFMTFACGIIGIMPTPNSISFFEDLKGEVENNGILTVGDQLDFYNVWLRHKDKIKLNKFDKKYKDYDLHDDSLIWSGDGSIKDIDKFRSELDLYKNI